MASRKRRFKDAKAKRERGGFVPLPFAVIRSQSFSRLSAHAVKLLCDLLAQYRGDNNGDLEMTWPTMRARGWVSRDTLQKARTELMTGGWIIVTRQGGRHQCSLYGVTFYAIDDCGGKLDIPATGSPTGDWKKNEPPAPAVPLRIVSRPAGQYPEYSHDRRVNEKQIAAN